MRRSLAVVLLVAVLGTGASAQSIMGISFLDEVIMPIEQVNPFEPFDIFIYLQPETATIGGYECSIVIDLVPVIYLSATGPNGWTNFGGGNDNHLVGFQTPVPVAGDFVVVCAMSAMLLEMGSYIPVWLGPAEPSSFDPPAPGYADGVNPDLLFPCDAVPGTLNTGLATEARSLSEVKTLFR